MPAVRSGTSSGLRSGVFDDSVTVMRLSPLLASLAFALVAGCSSVPRTMGGGGVGGVPASFLRLANEAQTSSTIAVRDGQTRATAWRALTDYLGQNHTIAVRDQAAGFAMTAWEASLMRDGVPDLRYRTRLVVTYLGDWRQLHVRAEANWKEGDEWQVGVDRELLAAATAELQKRVGTP
jgi:uncharacterized lipoprotein